MKKYYPNEVDNFDLLYENLENYTINIYIYKITNNKNIISKNYFENIKIFPDGNCFYRSLSKFLWDTENYHINIRNIIYNYALINKNTLDLENKVIENNGSTFSAELYLNKIQIPGIYAGELEIHLASLIFNISIYC